MGIPAGWVFLGSVEKAHDELRASWDRLIARAREAEVDVPSSALKWDAATTFDPRNDPATSIYQG